MSFLIVPFSFIKTKEEEKGISCESLICDEINYLKILLLCSNNVQPFENVEDNTENNVDNEHTSSHDDDGKNLNEGPESYSIKTDSIGYYDLKSNNSENNAIHINLKRKTIDLNIDGIISRITMKKGQIVVQNN
jgi:hypothetical protein